MLVDETAMLVEKGAYGAPWFLVKNKQGVEEPFFGSDRSAENVLRSSLILYADGYIQVPFHLSVLRDTIPGYKGTSAKLGVQAVGHDLRTDEVTAQDQYEHDIVRRDYFVDT